MNYEFKNDPDVVPCFHESAQPQQAFMVIARFSIHIELRTVIRALGPELAAKLIIYDAQPYLVSRAAEPEGSNAPFGPRLAILIEAGVCGHLVAYILQCVAVHVYWPRYCMSSGITPCAQVLRHKSSAWWRPLPPPALSTYGVRAPSAHGNATP